MIAKGDEHTRDRLREVTRRASMVQTEALAWLWPGFLPRKALVTVAGDPALARAS